MGTVVFNSAKGRAIELHRNIASNARPDAAFIVVLLQATEADNVLKDYISLDDILTAIGNTEATFTNYLRQALTDTELVNPIVTDNIGDRNTITLPTVTILAAGGALNNSLVKAIVCYTDDTTTAIDTTIEPIIAYDYVTTTDGNGLVIDFLSESFEAS